MPDVRRKRFDEQALDQLRRATEAVLDDHPELAAVSVTTVWSEELSGLPTGLIVVPVRQTVVNPSLVLRVAEETIRNARGLVDKALGMFSAAKPNAQESDRKDHNHESAERGVHEERGAG